MIEVQKLVPDSLHHTCVVATWANMGNGDHGQAIELANFADRSVQVIGDFGAGGNVRIEGSLDGTHYSPLTDPQGNNLDINAEKIEAITEVVRYVRPRVTSGDATTTLTVIMLLKGAM
jgi:hypothetical protein